MFQDLLRWHSYNINDELELLSLFSSREEWEACVELNHNASETPHIDLLCVREESKNDIRCTIKSTLDIGVNNFVFKASTSKICHNYSTFIFSFQ